MRGMCISESSSVLQYHSARYARAAYCHHASDFSATACGTQSRARTKTMSSCMLISYRMAPRCVRVMRLREPRTKRTSMPRHAASLTRRCCRIHARRLKLFGAVMMPITSFLGAPLGRQPSAYAAAA
eukprot:7376994-Prymnesium_polylepis.2